MANEHGAPWRHGEDPMTDESFADVRARIFHVTIRTGEGTDAQGKPIEEHPVIAEGRRLMEAAAHGQPPETLDEWRDVIDELDFALIATISARVLATEQIARLKVAMGVKQGIPLQRDREVMTRHSDVAKTLGLDFELRALMMGLTHKASSQFRHIERLSPEPDAI